MCFKGRGAETLGGLPHVQHGNVYVCVCILVVVYECVNIPLFVTESMCVQVYREALMFSRPPQVCSLP